MCRKTTAADGAVRCVENRGLRERVSTNRTLTVPNAENPDPHGEFSRGDELAAGSDLWSMSRTFADAM